MRKNKACPKCNSVTIGVYPEVAIMMNGKDGFASHFGLWSLYCCADCGYSEFYEVIPLSERPHTEGYRPVEERNCKFQWLSPPPPKTGPYR